VVRWRRKGGAIAYLIGVALLSLLFRAAVPPQAVGLSPADDQLFVRLAHHLLEGAWLGPFDDYTLAKGIFFPAFMATASAMELPLRIAEHLVYLLVSGFMGWVMTRLSGSRGLGMVGFTALAFNPVPWEASMARVARESLYMVLSLAVFALASILWLEDRGALARRTRCALSAVLGAVFAAYWLTREESVWLYPALGVLVAASLSPVVSSWWNGRLSGEAIRKLALASSVELGISSGVFLILAGSVATTNYMHYGAFLTSDFREGNFKKAFGALLRIKPDVWQRYVVFPEDAATRAYSVSPAVAELQSYLTSTGWAAYSCGLLQLNPCPKAVVGGWFMWALRDAVAWAGYYKTEGEAQRFYARLAEEVNEACDTNRIPCLARRSSLVPPFRSEYVRPMMDAAKRAVISLLWLGEGQVGASPSFGAPAQISFFEEIVGRVTPPDVAARTKLTLSGLVATYGGGPEVSVVNAKGQRVAAEIQAQPRPEAEALFRNRGMKDPKVIQFALSTDCPASRCHLKVQEPDGDFAVIPIITLAPGAEIQENHIWISVQNVKTLLFPGASGAAAERDRTIQSLMRPLAVAYAYATPFLLLVAMAGIVLCGCSPQRIRQHRALLALVGACAVACLTRVVVIAYIDASFWPAVRTYYLSAAVPFLILLVVVGLYLGYETLRVQWWEWMSRARVAAPNT
jgi:hypothetical protein